MTSLRLLLIMPAAGVHRLRVGRRWMSLREAPLTLTTLAALVPPELDVDCRLIDESVDPLPKEYATGEWDLVGISCLTGTAPRAYALADQFRKRGIPVILGGVHVTLLPDEARAHADAIVTGFAERAWPRLLKDFSVGRLAPRYDGGHPPLADLPTPRRDLQRRGAYIMPDTVFATRGCRGGCDFCSVPAARFGWGTRPVQDVAREVAALRGRRFAFNDVNLTDDRDYALALFRELAPLRKKWGGLATTRVADDPELLTALERAGCVYLLLGFESVTGEGLAAMGKSFNQVDHYRRTVDRLHARGVTVQGCFIFGLDTDTPAVFSDTTRMVQKLGVDIPRYAVYTPYPGTKAFRRLERDGRLLHQNWAYYDTQHVVFTPAGMSPRELDTGFVDAYRRTFSIGAILSRVARSPHPLVTLTGSVAYRRYIARLLRERTGAPVRLKAPTYLETLAMTP
ncbi:MAG: radical SAM protein [Lentisphaeria bacterium]|nr:radical SAM protein [Lentisphaeria bacterium]